MVSGKGDNWATGETTWGAGERGSGGVEGGGNVGLRWATGLARKGVVVQGGTGGTRGAGSTGAGGRGRPAVAGGMGQGWQGKAGCGDGGNREGGQWV